MKVRVTHDFGAYKAGQVFEWGDGFARLMIGRGVVQQVEDRMEAATVETRTERAAIDLKPRKRQK